MNRGINHLLIKLIEEECRSHNNNEFDWRRPFHNGLFYQSEVLYESR